LRGFSDSRGDRMNVHKNARLTPRGRERIVQQIASGQTPEAVAEAAGVCPRTVRKWVDRYRREGLAGLQDRSSRPHRLRRPTPQAVVDQIEKLRRQRWTGKQIAAETGVSPATVSRVLRRLGLNQLSALEPAEPIRRYERENPGELIHIDIKKLGRIGSVGHRKTETAGLMFVRHRSCHLRFNSPSSANCDQHRVQEFSCTYLRIAFAGMHSCSLRNKNACASNDAREIPFYRGSDHSEVKLNRRDCFQELM
jgi:transposase